MSELRSPGPEASDELLAQAVDATQCGLEGMHVLAAAGRGHVGDAIPRAPRRDRYASGVCLQESTQGRSELALVMRANRLIGGVFIGAERLPQRVTDHVERDRHDESDGPRNLGKDVRAHPAAPITRPWCRVADVTDARADG